MGIIAEQSADRVKTTARFTFVAALIVTLVMALLPHPPRLEIDSWGDKFQHALAFSTLTLLASASFPDATPLRIGERLSFLGALIEVLQAMPAIHRDCDVFDWLTDTTAIVVVLVLIDVTRRMMRRRVIAVSG